MPDALARAERLRSLHHGAEPLLLPNAWDAASARLVEAAGFPVVATASAAVTASLGYEDHEAAPREEMLAAAARICRSVTVPVTVDLEAGYGLAPEELAGRLAEIGAAGYNLEDTDHQTGTLVDADAQARRLAALREAAPALVVNARVDVFILEWGQPEERLDEAIRRGRLYRDAGADCVYPIIVTDEQLIARLVEGIGGPINVLYRPGMPSFARLAELGVKRISLGPGLHRATEAATRQLLTRIAAGEDPYTAPQGPEAAAS
jgi:2-methylisocitrate lyase-like PEP mutase family enzyme